MADLASVVEVTPTLQTLLGPLKSAMILPESERIQNAQRCRRDYKSHCFPPRFPPCSKKLCAEQCAALLSEPLTYLQKKHNYTSRFRFRNVHPNQETGRLKETADDFLVCCGESLDDPLFFSTGVDKPLLFVKGNVFAPLLRSMRGRETTLRDNEGGYTRLRINEERVADALCSVLQDRGCRSLSVWAIAVPFKQFGEDVTFSSAKEPENGFSVEKRDSESPVYRFVHARLAFQNWPPVRNTLYAAKVGKIEVAKNHEMQRSDDGTGLRRSSPSPAPRARSRSRRSRAPHRQ